jgi:[protein-PII] uridylyltransferase
MAEILPQPKVDLSQVAEGLHQTCVDYLTVHKNRLRQAIDAGEAGAASAAGLSGAYDGLLGTLFCGANAASKALGAQPKGRYALVAVGGYGRQLVGPHSDVDVLFLCDQPEDRAVSALAESVVYPLWDLGIDISQAVRGVEETVALSRSEIGRASCRERVS